MTTFHATITGSRYPVTGTVAAGSYEGAFAKAVKIYRKKFPKSPTPQLTIRLIKATTKGGVEHED